MEKKVKCKEMVSGSGKWGDFHRHRCSRWAVRDGFCNLHHPDKVEERRETSMKKYEERLRHTPLNIARRRIEELKAENEELKRRLREYEA